MPINPAVRYLQLGLKSLGYDPGPADGWYGSRTDAAATALYSAGPTRSSEWALKMLRTGLIGLGYLTATPEGGYDAPARTALGQVADHDGAPAASWARSGEILSPGKPALAVPHSNVLRQGSACTAIDTLMMHCGALPGDWHLGKSNDEIVAAIHRMHTLPVTRGGRGWSDTGYHEIICPDGERRAARPLGRYGAGAIGYNSGVKHILMIERRTIDRTYQPEDLYYPEQLASMREAVAEFGDRTQFKRLLGHREVAAKLCPGFDVIDRDWTDRAVA
ncbi:peptidoglycan-binding protein [Ponticoccus sp. (in: a-proteobacteria)]|uniref:peptidoglycan-binding protein n=1 Tax=Ponticoccus sp. (in: a-proteobacteria) TaxID=1925025 RepID=UPI003AB6A717